MRNQFACLAAIVSLALIAGCNNNTPEPAADETPSTTATSTPAEHADPHDVPMTEEEIAQLKKETETWDASIERIQSLKETIEKETTEGEAAKAHRALDQLDVVLESLPEAAQKSNVPKEQWQTVGEAAQKLRDNFNKVHANIDAGQAPDYAAVAGEIDTAISQLTAINAEPASP